MVDFMTTWWKSVRMAKYHNTPCKISKLDGENESISRITFYFNKNVNKDGGECRICQIFDIRYCAVAR